MLLSEDEGNVSLREATYPAAEWDKGMKAMSLGSGPMSPERWRPLEQVGWFIGVMAGVIVLACVWVFAIVQHLVGMIVHARLKS